MIGRAGLSLISFCLLSIIAQTSGSNTQGQENASKEEGEREKRIVGGQIAQKGACPHIARLALKADGSHACGASIIAPKWILTAAHCFDQQVEMQAGGEDVFKLFEVIVGDYKISEREKEEQHASIDQVFIHPDYDSVSNNNDIALVKLSKKLRFNDAVQPVSLSSKDAKPGRMCTLCGWGHTDRAEGKKTSSEVLKRVSLPIVGMKKCRAVHPDLAEAVTSNMFCAGDMEGTRDACEGDSGGPLVCSTSKDNYKQYGIVSFGPISCASMGWAGIYTRVSKYIDFVQSVTGLKL